MSLGTATLTVTVNSVAKVLNRIRDDGYASEYFLMESGEEWRLNIRHSKYNDAKRSGREVNRHNVELIHTYIGTPPTPNLVQKAYLVIENDTGDTLSEVEDVALGFLAFNTSANVGDLLNWIS